MLVVRFALQSLQSHKQPLLAAKFSCLFSKLALQLQRSWVLEIRWVYPAKTSGLRVAPENKSCDARKKEKKRKEKSKFSSEHEYAR